MFFTSSSLSSSISDIVALDLHKSENQIPTGSTRSLRSSWLKPVFDPRSTRKHFDPPALERRVLVSLFLTHGQIYA